MTTHNWYDHPGSIFVFGSNLLGDHVGGAAAYAVSHAKARMGCGQGRTGDAYALPTCSGPGVALDSESVRAAIQMWLQTVVAYDAKYGAGDTHHYSEWFVTAFGTGVAGFSHQDMIAMIADVKQKMNLKTPKDGHIIWPPEWAELYDDTRKTVVWLNTEYRQTLDDANYSLEYRRQGWREWTPLQTYVLMTSEFVNNVIIPLFGED